MLPLIEENTITNLVSRVKSGLPEIWSLLRQFQEISPLIRANASDAFKADIKLKEIKLFFLFLLMARMKNKNRVVTWAMILTLADNARGISGCSLSCHSCFGTSVSYTFVKDWMRDNLEKMLRTRLILLKSQDIVCLVYDNNQRWFSLKFQKGGVSSYNIKVTTKYAKKIDVYMFPHEYLLPSETIDQDDFDILNPNIIPPPNFPMFCDPSSISCILSSIMDVENIPRSTNSENTKCVLNYLDILVLVQNLKSVRSFVSSEHDISDEVSFPTIFKTETRLKVKLIAHYARPGIL